MFYTNLYARWQIALTARNTDAFFLNLTRNEKGLETEYHKLKDIQLFTDWLRRMAEQETANISIGSNIFMTAGTDSKCYM